MTSSKSYKRQRTVNAIIKYIVLIFFAGVVLIPLLIALSSSFKNESTLFDFPFKFFPKNPTNDNFLQLLDKFPLYTWNSIKLTLTIVLVQLVTSSTGAYVFSKLEWKGRDAIFGLYLASMMIPSQAVMIPQFLIIRNFNLYDTHAALVLLGSFTAFGTFLVRQYMLSIPRTYSEAARIDGAKEWTIFLQLLLPMSKTVLITQIIFSFRFFWNDFFTPLIYLTSDDLKTLPLGMTDFVREQYVYWGPQLAAALISIIPVMIVFLFGQKYFIQGVSSSGLKG
jgi:multiple sugar transport system permease protein